MRPGWIVTAAVAAGTACAVSKPPPAAPHRSPSPPACVRQPDDVAPITRASGSVTRVRYCVGDAADQCFALALGSGKLVHLAARPPAPPAAAGAPRIEATADGISVCTGGHCTPVAHAPKPADGKAQAATNGTVAVVLRGDAKAGKGYAEVWDVAKARRRARFHYRHGEFRCGRVAMLGDTIYVSASVCTDPSARGTLYTARGHRIAYVGGRDFGTYGHAFVQVDGPVWAFLSENGDKLVLQNVSDGKVSKTIDLAELWRASQPAADAKAGQEPMGNPGESTLLRLDPGHLGVIAGTPANGSVATIDLASGSVMVVHAPLCRSTAPTAPADP